MAIMDEATRKMIAEEFMVWAQFLNGCFIIWWWVHFTTISRAQREKFPRLARFFSWLSGCAALVIFVVYGLMDTIPFSNDSPNPLHRWMRIVLVGGYLAALGYIIKRRGEISPPTLPTAK
jgi:hypothetical protein